MSQQGSLKENILAWWKLFSLQSQLRAETEGMREIAAKQLGELGDARAVPALLKAVKDRSPGVRRASAAALGLLGDPKVVEPLLEAVNDSKRGVRLAAMTSLGGIGNARAVPVLTDALRDKDPDIRRAANESLIKLGFAAVDPLIEALNDPDEYLRQESIRALGKIKDPRAIEPLVNKLKQKGPDVKVAAAALDDLGWRPSKAEEIVLFAFARNRFDDLVSGGTASVEPLMEMLRREKSAEMKVVAARALGQIGDARAVPALVEALYSDSNEVAETAAASLGQIRDPSAVRPLIAALDVDNSDPRSLMA